MNAQEWLERTTEGMPESVRARVAAETLAHLEDADAGVWEDVRSVLGNPKVLRRELGRLYVPAERLRVLIEHDRSSARYIFPLLTLGLALLVFRSNDEPFWPVVLG